MIIEIILSTVIIAFLVFLWALEWRIEKARKKARGQAAEERADSKRKRWEGRERAIRAALCPDEIYGIKEPSPEEVFRFLRSSSNGMSEAKGAEFREAIDWAEDVCRRQEEREEGVEDNEHY